MTVVISQVSEVISWKQCFFLHCKIQQNHYKHLSFFLVMEVVRSIQYFNDDHRKQYVIRQIQENMLFILYFSGCFSFKRNFCPFVLYYITETEARWCGKERGDGTMFHNMLIFVLHLLLEQQQQKECLLWLDDSVAPT